jgi:hypothetical protein
MNIFDRLKDLMGFNKNQIQYQQLPSQAEINQNFQQGYHGTTVDPRFDPFDPTNQLPTSGSQVINRMRYTLNRKNCTPEQLIELNNETIGLNGNQQNHNFNRQKHLENEFNQSQQNQSYDYEQYSNQNIQFNPVGNFIMENSFKELRKAFIEFLKLSMYIECTVLKSDKQFFSFRYYIPTPIQEEFFTHLDSIFKGINLEFKINKDKQSKNIFEFRVSIQKNFTISNRASNTVTDEDMLLMLDGQTVNNITLDTKLIYTFQEIKFQVEESFSDFLEGIKIPLYLSRSIESVKDYKLLVRYLPIYLLEHISIAELADIDISKANVIIRNCDPIINCETGQIEFKTEINLNT